jgi:AraC family transcriptional regulator
VPKSSLSPCDPLTGKPITFLPDHSLRWSTGSRAWDGLVLERFAFESLDTPEFVLRDHSVTLKLSAPATVEHKIGGRFHRRLHVPGDVSVFPAGATRQVRTDQPHDVLVLTLTEELLSNGAGLASSPVLVECPQVSDAHIEHIVRALQIEAESGFRSGPLYGESLGVALATHLVSHYVADRAHAGRSVRGGIAPQRLRRVLAYIHENIAEDVRLTALAQVSGLSPCRFARNFRQSTGITPHQYVTRERVTQAKRMLRETDWSITTVASAVGCGTPSQFTALFRRATGRTPSDYRASFAN